MSGEVLTNLLMVHMRAEYPARDPQHAYYVWNWSVLGAEMSDVLEEPEPEGADWLWVTRTTEAAALMVRRYCSGECDEHIWSLGASYSLQSVQTWMEWGGVSEFVAGRMNNGKVALIFATPTEFGQRWYFMIPAFVDPKEILGTDTLYGIVSYGARSSVDWPDGRQIRSWFEALWESRLAV